MAPLTVFDLLAMHEFVAEDVRAVEFDAAGVRALIAEDSDLGRELTARFLAIVAERLEAARRRLVELYAYPEAVR